MCAAHVVMSMESCTLAWLAHKGSYPQRTLPLLETINSKELRDTSLHPCWMLMSLILGN